MRDLRLLVPAAACWIAAWLAVGAPDAGLPGWLPTVCGWSAAAAALVVVLVLRLRGGRARTPGVGPRTGSRSAPAIAIASSALVAAAAAAVAAHAAGIGLTTRDASPLTSAAAQSRTVEVVVELTAAPRAIRAPASMPWLGAADRVRVDARLLGVDGRAHAAVPVRVDGLTPSPDLAFGTRAGFRARVVAQASADASAFVLRPVAADQVDVHPPGPILAWAAELRRGFGVAADRLGGDGGALVPGLAIGDTSAVGPELDDAMKASSLSHLTAVSGANCAIVTALAFALAAACRAPRAVRVAMAIVALVAFTVLVTPESSVVRAGAMAVVVLAAVAAGRPGGGPAALSVAVIVLLVVDPWYARDYGFALSVFATAGLLLLAGPLGRVLGRFVPAPLAMAIAVPTAAQLACQPILVLLDPAVATYGVAANLLAGPAAPLGTLAGLAGCLLLPVLPSVGAAALQVAWLPASWIAMVAHGASTLPGARLPWLPDAAGALLLAAVTAGGLWLLLARRRPRIAVRVVGAGLAVAIAVPIGALVAGPALVRAEAPGNWDVAACDVGQGDAVLVRSSARVMLIDTGPDPSALATCLGLVGVDRIDLLVLTHWDADHVGGVDAIAGRVDVVLHGPLDGDRSARALDPLVAGGASAIEIEAGRRGALGDATWEAVWPDRGEPPGNDASVVLSIATPAFTGLFLGDLGEDAQRRLLAGGRIEPVDLVKVAHHGSADQHAALYEAIGASVGIIGVGADNGYGHPTAQLRDLLAATRTSVVRTDLTGTALLEADRDPSSPAGPADAGRFLLWSERAPVRRRAADARRPMRADPTHDDPVRDDPTHDDPTHDGGRT